MRLFLLSITALAIVLCGCCGSTTPSSTGYCPLGTYGSACTEVCQKLGMGEGCFSQCMDSVRSEGLGDATTCCRQSMRSYCDAMCTDLERRVGGDTPKSECMEYCESEYSATGLPFDSCYLPGL